MTHNNPYDADTPRPEPYDHYRPTTAEYRDGVYRVVGVGGDAVTLLYVADEDRRVASGRVVRVARGTLASGFEPAANPDAGLGVRTVVDAVEGVVETVRMLGDWLVRRLRSR